MTRMFGWIALGAAVLLVLWLAIGNGAAQATCEQTHSRDVCFLTLNP